MKHTWQKRKLTVAVSAALANASAVYAAGEIEEIIVTATKRAISMQDIAVAVQASSGDGMRAQGIETFDEYVETLPNVVGAGNGPGQKELYIRGSAAEQASVTVAPAQGSAPGVALYVDEQPVSFGGRNLDVYGVDLERIEVLSGPQGTLFGASSQSGNLRLITNKPRHGEFEGGFNARYGMTRDGSDSASVDGYINVPLGDALAARVVVYSDNQGGWIDNVPGTFTPSGMVVDRNNVAGYGPPLTPRTPEQRAMQMAGSDSIASARNDGIAKDDFNDASYSGMRLGLSWDVNDDWNLLLQHTAQTLETEGTFLNDPSMGGTKINRFVDEYNDDEFGLTTWTLTGRLWQLDMVYTGGRLDREVDAIIDYTDYNNGGGYITYYLCSGNIYESPVGRDPNNCFDPTKQYMEDTKNVRETHEFRFTTDPSRRWRILAGVYINDVETNHVGDFQYASTNAAFAEHINSSNQDNSGDGFLVGNTTLPTRGVNTSGPRSPYTTFFNDFTRTEDETAFFGEVAFDLTDAWTVSLSARRYDLTSQLAGAANFSFGCRYGIGSNAQETADGRCNGTDFSNDVSKRLRTLGQYAASGDDSIILNARSPNGEDGSPRDLFRGCSGCGNGDTLAAIKNGFLDIGNLESDGSINEEDTIAKASISWQPTNDLMLFATYAEGYRPATQNRNAGQLSTNQSGVFENYVVPAAALTDHLTSYELGAKGDFFSGSLRINATLFRSDIEDLQVSRFDPSNVAFLFFAENVGDAEATGFDADFQWLPTANLSIMGAFSLLSTELTRVNDQLQGIVVPTGSDLPLAPSFAGNIRVRYDFRLDALDADAFLTASVNYRGESVSGVVGNAEFLDDTKFRQSGRYSGIKRQNEGGTFGTVAIPDGNGGERLPRNSRFVNPAATTLNASVGFAREGWRVELFGNNLNNEDAQVTQIVGHYTPFVTQARPRTFGVSLSYDFF